ncbi:MAG: hypothetical protein IH846_14490 [Acidobacteria bacterium]|nr:hypothetical protein [Acidobacteriota bacterium]
MDLPFGFLPQSVQPFPDLPLKLGRSRAQPVVGDRANDPLLAAQPAQTKIFPASLLCGAGFAELGDILGKAAREPVEKLFQTGCILDAQLFQGALDCFGNVRGRKLR